VTQPLHTSRHIKNLGNTRIAYKPRHVVSESEEAVLKKGLNFAITKPHSIMDFACAAEAPVLNLPGTLGHGIQMKDQNYVGEIQASTPPTCPSKNLKL
jgi:hypothetical protein